MTVRQLVFGCRSRLFR